MTVISTHTDPEALTLTLVAEFDAPAASVWQLWADPRKLERWWGPPTWPATFTEHEFAEGGGSRYHMTGPEGEKAPGWMRFTSVRPTSALEYDDGFLDSAGRPDPSMPVSHTRVTFDAVETASGASGTRMTTFMTFPSADDMAKLLAMGQEEGMRLAMGQMDALLA